MIHVQSVVSNLKTGVNLAGLGTKVLIIGNNEAGKSAVTDSIALALQGFVPRLAGKDRRRESELMTLAHHVEGQAFSGRLEVRVGLSDGSEAVRILEGNLASAKLITADVPKVATKMFDLGALRHVLVEAGDEPRRRFFLEESGVVQVTEPDLFVQVPDAYKPLWQRLRGPASSAAGVVLLRRLGEAAGPALAAARTHVRNLTVSLDRVAASMGSVTLQSDLDEARRRVEQAKQKLARHDVDSRTWTAEHARLTREVEQAKLAVAQWEAEIARIAQTRCDLQETFDQMEPALAAAPAEAPAPDTIKLIEALALVAAQQATILRQGHPTCVLCQHPVEVQAASAFAADVQAEAARLLRGAQTNALRARHGEVIAQILTADAQAVSAEGSLQGWRERLAAEQILLDECLTDRPAPLDVAALTTSIQQYEAMLQGDTRQVEVNRLKTEILDAEQEVTRLEGFVGEIKSMTQRLLADARTKIEDAVSAYLPEGERFRLLLEYEGRALCLVGLERAGRLDVALSDSTWDRVVLAVAAALAENYDLAVLVGEDRAYDGETLAKTMRALTRAKAQIILTSPVAPAGRTPAGWQVIQASAVRDGQIVEAKPAKAERKPKKAKDEVDAAASTETTTVVAPGDDTGEDSDAGTGASEFPLGQPDLNPRLADGAPTWAIVHGHVTWVGPADGVGTAGKTYAQALADHGVAVGGLTEAWTDPRPGIDQRFYTGKASIGRTPGVVVRQVGKRLFVYAPLTGWGDLIGVGPKSRVPFEAKLLNVAPLGRGHMLLLDNLYRVYQHPDEAGGPDPVWFVFTGDSAKPATVEA